MLAKQPRQQVHTASTQTEDQAKCLHAACRLLGSGAVEGVVVQALLIVSQLARMDQSNYGPLAESGICSRVGAPTDLHRTLVANAVGAVQHLSRLSSAGVGRRNRWRSHEALQRLSAALHRCWNGQRFVLHRLGCVVISRLRLLNMGC